MHTSSPPYISHASAPPAWTGQPSAAATAAAGQPFGGSGTTATTRGPIVPRPRIDSASRRMFDQIPILMRLPEIRLPDPDDQATTQQEKMANGEWRMANGEGQSGHPGHQTLRPPLTDHQSPLTDHQSPLTTHDSRSYQGANAPRSPEDFKTTAFQPRPAKELWPMPGPSWMQPKYALAIVGVLISLLIAVLWAGRHPSPARPAASTPNQIPDAGPENKFQIPNSKSETNTRFQAPDTRAPDEQTARPADHPPATQRVAATYQSPITRLPATSPPENKSQIPNHKSQTNSKFQASNTRPPDDQTPDDQTTDLNYLQGYQGANAPRSPAEAGFRPVPGVARLEGTIQKTELRAYDERHGSSFH